MQRTKLANYDGGKRAGEIEVFTCPHCGRQTRVFGAEQFDTIEMGRGMCTHCGQEFLIVNDIAMTEQQYREGSKVQ